MSKVWITKSGFRAEEWDSTERRNVDKPIGDILHELRSTCHVEQGTTLGDFFNVVAAWPRLMDVIGHYSWCDVEAFHREAKRPTVKKSDLHSIELAKYIELSKHGSGEHTHVSGIGPNDEGTIISWAIEFTPVNEMLHLPIVLNPEVSIRDQRTDDWKELGKTPTYFSLLEVVGEIYYEISFAGSPDDRDEMRDGIMQSAEEVKNGTATLIPWEPPKEIIH